MFFISSNILNIGGFFQIKMVESNQSNGLQPQEDESPTSQVKKIKAEKDKQQVQAPVQRATSEEQP